MLQSETKEQLLNILVNDRKMNQSRIKELEEKIEETNVENTQLKKRIIEYSEFEMERNSFVEEIRKVSELVKTRRLGGLSSSWDYLR